MSLLGRIRPPDLRDLLFDLRVAAVFLTRAPIQVDRAISPADVLRAGWAYPAIGLALGLIAGLGYALLILVGAPPLAAAGAAFAALALMTGALHEDGLADMADGLGGGKDRDDRLRILRDSRLGAYGVLALTLTLILRAGSLAAFGPVTGLAALVAACGIARGAALTPRMFTLPIRRDQGLPGIAGAADRPSAAQNAHVAIAAAATALVAIIVAAVAGVGFAAGLSGGLVALIVAAAAASSVGLLAARSIGGHTGDVLGAAEQCAEAAVLVTLAAIWAG